MAAGGQSAQLRLCGGQRSAILTGQPRHDEDTACQAQLLARVGHTVHLSQVGVCGLGLWHAAQIAQQRRIAALHADFDISAPGGLQELQQLAVEMFGPRFTSPRQRQSAVDDAGTDRLDARVRSCANTGSRR